MPGDRNLRVGRRGLTGHVKSLHIYDCLNCILQLVLGKLVLHPYLKGGG